jgi:hypothetical protein
VAPKDALHDSSASQADDSKTSAANALTIENPRRMGIAIRLVTRWIHPSRMKLRPSIAAAV